MIIDEQHRFGVLQRAKFFEKASPSPHILVMTATPIPRTLALTHYGELASSTLDELPKGRKPILTAHRTHSSRVRIHHFIKKELSAGKQAYIVYPIIEESAQLDLEALAANYAAIQKIFSPYKVECLHGKMHIEDKKLSMQRFINKEAQLLVATTVIEVGVDVPSATVMLIEEADRFGLAQLHQLRGRIGRGSESSYCILMTKSRLSADARKRIAALLRTQDGFELAEEDLKQRGPGNMLGTQQSGVMRFKISDVVEDKQTFIETRVLAARLLQEDPDLQAEKNKNFLKYFGAWKLREKDWMRIG